MPSNFIISGLLAITLALTHIFCGKLRFVDIPRSSWLSGAGGVSVAYVFIHILPELQEHQGSLERSGTGIILYIENHVYLTALIGLGIFYWLERLAIVSRKQQKKVGQPTIASGRIFWVHVVFFAIYNGLIGYLLLHREETDIASSISYTLAMGLHFVVNDHGLRQLYKSVYDGVGKWILAFSIILGWVIGNNTEIGEAAIAVLFSFLAGGIILNVLKEELPEERESSFWAFALGASIYTILSYA